MSIDFFREECKTESDKAEFGLCDDPPPSVKPAYIDEEDQSKWIAVVKNPGSKDVQFFAIDNCVPIFKDDGNMETRCDGLLKYANDVIFVELKSRKGGQWVKKGREQLTTIVELFKAENDTSAYKSMKAYICNSLRPRSNSGHFSNIQKFRDDT